MKELLVKAIELVQEAVDGCAECKDGVLAYADIFRPELKAGDVCPDCKEQRDFLARARAALETTAQPLGYMHEVTEREFGYMKMYSEFELNPWAHWVKKHKAECTFKCTPLYAGPAEKTNELHPKGEPPVMNPKTGAPLVELSGLTPPHSEAAPAVGAPPPGAAEKGSQ